LLKKAINRFHLLDRYDSPLGTRRWISKFALLEGDGPELGKEFRKVPSSSATLSPMLFLDAAHYLSQKRHQGYVCRLPS